MLGYQGIKGLIQKDDKAHISQIQQAMYSAGLQVPGMNGMSVKEYESFLANKWDQYLATLSNPSLGYVPDYSGSPLPSGADWASALPGATAGAGDIRMDLGGSGLAKPFSTTGGGVTVNVDARGAILPDGYSMDRFADALVPQVAAALQRAQLA